MMEKVSVLTSTALDYEYSRIVALAYEDSTLLPIAVERLTLDKINGFFSTSFTSGGAPGARR